MQDIDQMTPVGEIVLENVTVEKKEILNMDFLEKIQGFPSNEEKVHFCLDYMRDSLSQGEKPDFRGFWDARHHCLILFKEHLSPMMRAQFWSEFVELSEEGRRLKEVLDEQSQFAITQIDLAISSMEGDLLHYEDLLGQVLWVELPFQSETIKAHEKEYQVFQRELTLLNSWAVRINSLRKEVMKTGMRIREKNKFLKRLSLVGDQVFPKRKELILNVSVLFESDVRTFFYDKYFQNENDIEKAPMYVLRDEIKCLQEMTKILTLSTQCFTDMRLCLSECWDKVKEFEKEYKKVVAEKRQVYKQNIDQAEEKVKEFIESIPSLSRDDLLQKREELHFSLRSIEMRREDVRYLKEKIDNAIDTVVEVSHQEKEKKVKDASQSKKEKVEALKKKLALLVEEGKKVELTELVTSWQKWTAEFKEFSLSSWEEKGFEQLIKSMKDILADKKEKAIVGSTGEKISLEQLRKLYVQKKENRQEIKEQLENYRRVLGGSGLDFEKAMMYRELIDAEKSKLEKANVAISEIEDQISSLEETSSN
ncbi:MAG: hypothetical protein WCP39_06195 [Chlamydiota bacterium]